jgi:hypothetical protein
MPAFGRELPVTLHQDNVQYRVTDTENGCCAKNQDI